MVTGARQVGKTYLIRAFAEANYKNVVEINLVENKASVKVLEGANNAMDLFARISAIAEKELIPNKTLIFLDEIQEFSEIITYIKFLVEQTDYDFILSGSLLGVELKNVRSVPVGYLDTVELYPLDFEEYIVARGISEELINIVKQAFIDRTEVPDYLHEKMLSLFYEYLIVGGMPAVVAEFCESRNLQNVKRLQENIILQNKNDISKYNTAQSLIIKDIYGLIPSELNKKNKRFIISNMDERGRFSKYLNDFVWLTDAGVALPVYTVSEPVYPLKLSKASNLFKLFMNDVGLLMSTLIKDVTLEILSKNVNVNYGSIFENVVAQELQAAGFDLYYYNSKKNGEVDFIIETRRGHVYPIEVKAGKDYKRHKALNNILSFQDYHLDRAIVLGESNVESDNAISYLPIYMTMFCGILD